MNQPDSSLIRGCQAGDRKAWETLILRYERMIYSIAMRYRLSEDDAGDVFQSVCVKLLEHVSTVKDDSHLQGWLITTAKYECFRVIRYRSRLTSYNDGSETTTEVANLSSVDPLPESVVLQVEIEQRVRGAMDEIGANCKRLLSLLYHTDPPPSYTEIAKLMDISAGAVGPTRARCLQKLKRILDKEGFT